MILKSDIIEAINRLETVNRVEAINRAGVINNLSRDLAALSIRVSDLEKKNNEKIKITKSTNAQKQPRDKSGKFAKK